MKSHQYADLFPMMATVDIARLADDIRENGLADPIVTYEGKILDGRNRYQACLMAEVEPRFAEYEGTTPLVFVVSHNLHRRHLNESQRGMVGARLANLGKGNPTGANQHSGGNSAIALIPTQKEAAKMLNIGVDSIKRSKQVMRDGIPELQDMQMSGEVSARAASIVSKLTEEDQRKAVSGGVAGVKQAAKGATSEKSPAVDQEESPQAAAPKKERIPNWIPDDAERLWTLARQDLNKILKTDKSRVRILNEIITYAQTRISENR